MPRQHVDASTSRRHVQAQIALEWQQRITHVCPDALDNWRWELVAIESISHGGRRLPIAKRGEDVRDAGADTDVIAGKPAVAGTERRIQPVNLWIIFRIDRRLRMLLAAHRLDGERRFSVSRVLGELLRWTERQAAR